MPAPGRTRWDDRAVRRVLGHRRNEAYFLGHRRDHDRALKRGGGKRPLSIDVRDAEGRYLREPADQLTPEVQFVRRWVLALLEGVLDHLRGEYAGAGKSEVFDALKATLTGDPRSAP